MADTRATRSPAGQAADLGQVSKSQRAKVEPFVLLSLDPLAAGEKPAEIFGQEEALGGLDNMVSDVLSATERPGHVLNVPQSGIFALFGRYGQGKTTLLRRVHRRFDGRLMNLRKSVRRLRVREFDVAVHRPESLNYELDRLIADWYLRARIQMIACSLVSLTLFAWLCRAWLPIPSWFHELVKKTGGVSDLAGAGALAAVAATVWSIGGPVLRALAREEQSAQRRLSQGWNVGDWTLLVRVLQDALVGPPDLLIVDNLDRAVPDQQRAFLLALRRHRAFLPAVVIVAFDETPLSLSDASPDTPQELLSKAFTSAVRLYPMTRDDAATIVIDILDQLYQRDPHAQSYPLVLLQHAHVSGDLARIFLFHRRHSVRFCRQFVNVIATTAATLCIDDPGDFSALMRVQGLFEFLPWIRNDPIALGDLLEREDIDKLLIYATSLSGKSALPADISETVKAFLLSTRHMQPINNGWRDFIGRFSRGAAEGSRPTDSRLERIHIFQPLVWSADQDKIRLRNSWIRFDLALADEPRPEWRARSYKMALSRGPAPATDTTYELPVRLAYTYFVQRLWHADADFLKQRDIHKSFYASQTRLAAPFWLPDTEEEEIEDTPLDEVIDTFQLLFMQIAWPLPPEVVGLYPGVLTAASPVGRARGVSAVAFWLDRLLKLAEGRVPTFPEQFGRPLGVSSTSGATPYFGLVLDCLPSLPVYLDDGETIDWMMVSRIIDLLGRLQRDGHPVALDRVQNLLRAVLDDPSYEVATLRQLMEAIAGGLPSPDGASDGVVELSAVRRLASLFDKARWRAPSQAPFRTAVRQLCASPASANLLLLARAAGHKEASDILDMWADQPKQPNEWYQNVLAAI